VSTNRPRPTTSVLTLLVFLSVCLGVAASEGRTQSAKTQAGDKAEFKTDSPKVHMGEGWAIAAPAEWRDSQIKTKVIVLYLTGSGVGGVPAVDGTLAPLQIGIAIDVFDKTEMSPREKAQKDVAELKALTKMFKVRSEPSLEDVELSDGVKAAFLSLEFDRLDNNRLSFQFRVYVAGSEKKLIVANGFLACGRGGGAGILTFLKAHAMSLVLDAKKVDQERLKKVYTKHNWGLKKALAMTLTGNQHLEQKKYPEAKKAFLEALALCEYISAAQNGLAWTLINADDPKVRDLTEGLRHAKAAVDLTERRDTAALDTLAVGYFTSGDKKKAVETIREALETRPNDEYLLKQLKAFEAGK